jgi:hypothetical protein
MGVQPIAVSWRATGEADPNTIYLIAKYAETSYEVAAATDMLFQRLTQWAADATPHAPVEPAATKASTDRA